MPIDFNRLPLETNFLIVSAEQTVEAVYAMLPEQRNDRAFMYILADLGNARWFVARWIEIEEIARLAGTNRVRFSKLRYLVRINDQLSNPDPGRYAKLAHLDLSGLQALLEPTDAIDKDTSTTQEARDLRDQHPAKRVVVSAGDQVIGLLTTQTLSADILGNDVFARQDRSTTVVLSNNDNNLESASPNPKGIEALDPPQMADADILARDEQASEQPKRVFNHWMEQLNKDGTSTVLDNTIPLKAGTVYELKINLAAPRSMAFEHTSAQALTDLEKGLGEDLKLLDILIVLASDDVIMYGSKEQVLTIERDAFSKNTATFAIEPKRGSECRIDAAFFYQGRCFQIVEYSLQVGGRNTGKQVLFAKETRGRTLEGVIHKKTSSQPYSLVIVKRENGYQFILSGAGVTRAFVPLTPQGIAQLVADARMDLLDIVSTDYQNDKVYQSEQTLIPPDVHAQTLNKLARRGTLLFKRLFGGTQGGPEMAELLSQISRAKRLHIEVIAEEFIFPWAMLYDGALDPVDPQGFWGFKHVIEYIPEFTLRTPRSFDLDLVTLKATEPVAMAFVANTKIDDELQAAMPPYPKVIEPQTTFFSGLKTVAMQRHTTTKEFIDLLNNPQAPPLIYINCHASTNAPAEAGGTYKSFLVLSDGKINIDDLDLDAPPIANGGLLNGPLVFLNACQSAELTPYLYAGLVPAMLARGARGVIGTEVNTPTLFAAEFAQKLIERFAAGNAAVGDLLLDLRREYLTDKNNVMGLVYALYSNGDLIVNRA